MGKSNKYERESFSSLAISRVDPSIIDISPNKWTDLQIFRFFNACNAARTTFYRKGNSKHIGVPKIKTPTEVDLKSFMPKKIDVIRVFIEADLFDKSIKLWTDKDWNQMKSKFNQIGVIHRKKEKHFDDESILYEGITTRSMVKKSIPQSKRENKIDSHCHETSTSEEDSEYVATQNEEPEKCCDLKCTCNILYDCKFQCRSCGQILANKIFLQCQVHLEIPINMLPQCDKCDPYIYSKQNPIWWQATDIQRDGEQKDFAIW